MATALLRTACRLCSVQRSLLLRVSSHFQTTPPRRPSLSSTTDALPLMDQRCLFSTSTTDTTSKPNSEKSDAKEFNKDEKSGVSSTSATDTTAKPNSENSDAKDSNKDEKSGGSESSGGSSNDKSGSASGKDVRGGPVSWMSFLLLVATGAGLIFYYDREKKRHIEEINRNSKAVKEGPSAGKAAIGGPFSLTRDDGKRVTEIDFMGKWSIIYFGFTHCPDICPDELVKLADAVNKIKEKSGIDIVPVFISVDPERDTVKQVHEYVKEFHPNLVGLTGSPEEIKSVARAYRVYYMKTAEEDADYLVDHSIIMYLMSPSMDFVKFYGKNHDVDSLTDGVIKAIKQYRK